MVVYFILYFMLELEFFFPPLQKFEAPGLEGTVARNTFDNKRSSAAGASKMVSGHAGVAAGVGLGDVGDA